MLDKQVHIQFLFALFFIAFLGIQNVLAQYTIETVPNNKLINNSYVSDPGKVLSSKTTLTIDKICAEVESSVGAQIAVVILNSISETNPHDFGTQLFNYWGIGQAGIDNGLLILLVMDQRRVEFITGNGTEEILPDILCYNIQQESMVPFFKEGDYDQGVLKGLQDCADVLINNKIFDPNDHNLTVKGASSSHIRRIAVKYLLYIALPILCLYLLILIYLQFSEKDFYKKYQIIRPFSIQFLAIFFPVPFVPIYFINKKLSEYYRNAPRFSKKTGALMRRMSEHEDDQYLEEGMITEELVNSIDYDVWVGKDQYDTLILAYKHPFSKFTNCPKCHYSTYQLIYSKTITSPTYSRRGSGEQKKACSHCKHTAVSSYTIAKLQSSSSSGSSSGGGSWGGGSSSGGGAGSSW